MEKFTTRSRSIKYFGLLVFILLFFVQNAFSFSWRDLCVVSEQEYCFSGEPCVFKLEIPGVLPSRVEFTVQSMPNNVTLLSSDKEEYIKDGERGTVVKFVIKFAKSGTYKFPSLAAHIDWNWSTIPFAPITVYENPMLLMPELNAEIPSVISLGESVSFTLQGKYFLEIMSINADLNPTFILEQTNLLIDLPYTKKEFSVETLPIAEYKITPIEIGTFVIPKISVHCRSYSESTTDISLPTQKITVMTPLVEEDNNTETENFFESLKNFENQDFESNIIENVDIDSLVKTAEKNKMINTIVLHCVIIFLLVFAILLILAIITKNQKMIAISIVLLVILITCYFVLRFLLSTDYCICYDCKANTIPEENANSVMQLSAGTKLKILDETSLWYFIETPENKNGWILKSNCVVIM